MLGLDEFGNAFVDVYVDDLEKAHLVFDELPSQDLALWNWICMPNVVK